MTRQTIHLDDLLSRKVQDAAGKPAGRIEEVLARRKDGRYYVAEYHLGRAALNERLGLVPFSEGLIHLLGGRRRSASHKVPWDQMDLSDPLHPKLRCLVSELEEIKD
jgi:hypothetical protein